MKFLVILVAIWLVLNETLVPGHVILGAFVGVIALAGYRRLQAGQETARVNRVWTVVKLAGTVAIDIVASNVAVARIVLGLRRGTRFPGFLPIPLSLRHPAGLAALACIVTATPGTSWVRYERTQGMLTLHVLDLTEPEATVEVFKQRYETPLMEIFE